ncbi:SusC/RagA family TonB-linked outer membrane protein [Bacteroidia bacterium]|nr:SusC/RagA family TonB-linked outer membrane protein [Bacteroidia bacterium]
MITFKTTKKKSYFLSVFFLLISATTFAEHKIEGRILDTQSDEPLAGAIITLPDGKTGTGADDNGKFSIKVDALPVTLTVAYAGYKNTELEIYEYSEPLTVFLQEDRNLLNTVVVVGYGTQKRKELTGSVVTVNKEALKQPAVSIDNALSGQVAGLNVSANSGAPGATSKVRIRGGNSITGGNEPLYVIDGVIVYNDNAATRTGGGKFDGGLNPLSSINPANVESVEVLKDVSATAIYGSRGANGVILITTKKGQKGKSVINYTNSFGWSQAAGKLDLLTGKEWADLYEEATGKDWRIAAYGTTDGIDRNRNFDWQDEVLNTGFTHTHQLSISGGDEKTRYLISGNYTDQEGIVRNTGLERFGGRVNLDRDFNKKLNVGTNVSVNQTKTSGFANYASKNSGGRVSGSFDYALRQAPVFPIYNADGSYNYNFPLADADFTLNGQAVNPISDLDNTTADTRNTSVLANFYARYAILPYLSAKINSGFNLNQTEQSFYAPSTSGIGLLTNGYGSIGNKYYNTWQNEFTLNFNKRFNDIHLLDVLAGYTNQQTVSKYSASSSTNYLNESLGYNDLAGGSNLISPISGIVEGALHSWLGRVNYSLLDRYNVTASFRADGSSRFAKGQKWGYFPSLGVSWNIEKENFFNQSSEINNLKLRASIGVVGNQEIGDYRFADSYTPVLYSLGGNLAAGYIRGNLANPDLKWETTTQGNIGVDLGVWQDRLTASLDVYSKKTNDLLVDIPVEQTTGFTSKLANVGSVTNKGVELELGGVIIDKRRFRWTVNANIAHNRNEVTDLGGQKQFFPYVDSKELNTLVQVSSGQVVLVKVGEPLGSIYGLEFDGIVQNATEAAGTPKPSWATGVNAGDVKYKDQNEDGVIDDSDRKVLGSVQPKFTYGLSSALTYKNLDFSFAFAGSYGNSLYNGLRQNLETFTGKGYNLSGDLTDRWTESNPSNEIGKIAPAAALRLDSRYVEDASYLKLKNITVGYTLPVRLQFVPSARLRIYASAQNLFTVTKYKGYDPESSRYGGDESSSLFQGIDFGAYPSARTFLFGVNLTL